MMHPRIRGFLGPVALIGLLLTAWAVRDAMAQSPANLTAYGLRLDTGNKAATAAAGAATLNKASGVVTTEPLTTAAGSNYTLTLSNATVTANDQVYASVAYGTATAGSPVVGGVRPGNGSIFIVVRNMDPTAALNGTLRVSFFTLKN